MYIGPWQEYKLAKIQDAAVQKLKQEWEEHLKSTIVSQGDEERVRQMMEPILSKLPAMLLASRSKTILPQSRELSRKSNKRSSIAGRQISDNQETTHPTEAEVILPTRRKSSSKPVKKTKAPPVKGVDEVAKRKQMWRAPSEKTTVAHREEVRLPPIQPQQPLDEVIPTGPSVVSVIEPVHLPALDNPTHPEVDEDSLDEAELESFLNWTDQLAHPDVDIDDFLNG